MTPDILLAGHIVRDITPSGWRVGGGVAYGAWQAHRLGLSVAGLTSCADDLSPTQELPGIEWRVTPSSVSTSFENIYESGRRRQRVLSQAATLRAGDLPPDWQASPIALLCPVLNEIDDGLVDQVAETSGLLAVGAQGWLRHLEGDRVSVDRLELRPRWLEGADIVFVSQEDALDAENAGRWQAEGRVVVLTRGIGGCTLWDRDGRHDVSAFDSQEVDPTGAGDVFATAFAVRYHETSDAIEAAMYGSAAAALAVGAEGTDGIAGRDVIEELIRNQRAVHSR